MFVVVCRGGGGGSDFDPVGRQRHNEHRLSDDTRDEAERRLHPDRQLQQLPAGVRWANTELTLS